MFILSLKLSSTSVVLNVIILQVKICCASNYNTQYKQLIMNTIKGTQLRCLMVDENRH